jgi:hypothetical protein
MTFKKKSSDILLLVASAVFIFLLTTPLRAQEMKAAGYDKGRGHEMVSQIKSEVKKNYYDPTFRARCFPLSGESKK